MEANLPMVNREGCAGGRMKAIEDLEIYRRVLQSLASGVYVVDCEQRVIFWNEGAEAITGYLSQEVLGRRCDEHFPGHVDGENQAMNGPSAPIGVAIRDGKPVSAQVSLRHKSGHPVLVRVRATPIRNGDGTIIGGAESFDQAGAAVDRDNRSSKLEHLGCVDSATGTLNHEYTQTQIREHLETYAEHRVPMSVLMIRVDNIDKLRAHDGNGVVATVMRVAAQTLTNSLRPTDLVGRWKDTEFMALATECNSWEAMKLGDRLRKMIHGAEVTWWGDRIRLSASIGGTSAKVGDTVETIVARARAGLEESIGQGGDRVTVHQD
jgi:diguanylate cyclase (GGDEF)-like protein/PAS domain S-box-containing protein